MAQSHLPELSSALTCVRATAPQPGWWLCLDTVLQFLSAFNGVTKSGARSPNLGLTESWPNGLGFRVYHCEARSWSRPGPEVCSSRSKYRDASSSISRCPSLYVSPKQPGWCKTAQIVWWWWHRSDGPDNSLHCLYHQLPPWPQAHHFALPYLHLPIWQEEIMLPCLVQLLGRSVRHRFLRSWDATGDV